MKNRITTKCTVGNILPVLYRSNVTEISSVAVDGDYQLKRSGVIGVVEMKGGGGHCVAQLVGQCTTRQKIEGSIAGVFK
jgi:hypothetical protein